MHYVGTSSYHIYFESWSVKNITMICYYSPIVETEVRTTGEACKENYFTILIQDWSIHAEARHRRYVWIITGTSFEADGRHESKIESKNKHDFLTFVVFHNYFDTITLQVGIIRKHALLHELPIMYATCITI